MCDAVVEEEAGEDEAAGQFDDVVPWTVRLARADGSDPRVLRRGFFADWQRLLDD